MVARRAWLPSGAKVNALPEGLFVAFVGPSGAGKDTLLAEAASALHHCRDFIFVRRTVTRPADGVTEDHNTLSSEAFVAARQAGAFSLCWDAHGLLYGLPRKAREEVDSGRVVIANVSRTVLDEAVRIFRRIAVVEIHADPSIRAMRIAARGREPPADADARVRRTVSLEVPPGSVHIRIDNSGSLETAVAILVRNLLDLRHCEN